MTPIQFKQHNVIFAKNQPQYQPLPAFINEHGEVISCWKLTPMERIKIALGNPLWLRQYTFNQALQPQLPQLENPFQK